MFNLTLPQAGTTYGTNVIYGLSCSCAPEHIRYVGKTTLGAEARLRGHLHEALVQPNGRGRNPKHDWIRSHLARQGDHQIQTRTLGEYSKEELGAWEQHWISVLYEDGHELLNADAHSLTPHSAAVKQKIAASVRQQWAQMSDSERADFEARRTPGRLVYWQNVSAEERAARGSAISAAQKRRFTEASDEWWIQQKQRLSAGQQKRRANETAESRRGSMAVASHTRWHTNRGITKADCEFCAANERKE